LELRQLRRAQTGKGQSRDTVNRKFDKGYTLRACRFLIDSLAGC